MIIHYKSTYQTTENKEIKDRQDMENTKDTKLPASPPLADAAGSAPEINRSIGTPTGYLIWDDGKLMQQFEYEERRWFGYWQITKQTEWIEVPTKKSPNVPAQRPPATDT